MWKSTFRVGLLLGWKQIRKGSIWLNILIVFIMVLTFLNLVVLSGILVGLLEGAVIANKAQYTGGVFLTVPAGEKHIEQTGGVLSTIETLPGVENYSARFVEGATIEANYRTNIDSDKVPDSVGTSLVGIDPDDEAAVTQLNDFVVEGEYLEPGDGSYILLGSYLVERYVQEFGEGFGSLSDVFPGTKVRVTVGGATKEYEVKGIIDSKVDAVSFRAFITDSEFVRFGGRGDLNVDEVAIVMRGGASEESVKNALLASGVGEFAAVKTSREAVGQFLEDIQATFNLLGTVFSAIGLLVAVITVFIVIFINAITRRKYIGILQGIGIRARAIEFSYIFQAMVYAVIGSVIGLLLTYGVLVPYFAAHPLDFPFSDGILVAPVGGTLIRVGVLLFFTVVAGYAPARIITQKNVLDSILGR